MLDFKEYSLTELRATTKRLGVNLEPSLIIAELMMLGGAKVRGGDVQAALELSGLKLVRDSRRQEPWSMFKKSIENGTCRSCGAPIRRIRNAENPDNSWRHIDPYHFMNDCQHIGDGVWREDQDGELVMFGFGYIRRCWKEEELRTMKRIEESFDTEEE